MTARATYLAPERGRVVRLDDVRQLVREHVVDDPLGREHQTPVQVHQPVGPAASPARAHALDEDALRGVPYRPRHRHVPAVEDVARLAEQPALHGEPHHRAAALGLQVARDRDAQRRAVLGDRVVGRAVGLLDAQAQALAEIGDLVALVEAARAQTPHAVERLAALLLYPGPELLDDRADLARRRALRRVHFDASVGTNDHSDRAPGTAMDLVGTGSAGQSQFGHGPNFSALPRPVGRFSR